MKTSQKILIIGASLLLNHSYGESLTGTVSGENPHVTVNFTRQADLSYSIKAEPGNGWIFTEAFSWNGPNGWYSDSKYNIACERLSSGQTVFVDASLCFGASMNGTMYKPGDKGSPIPWSVSSSSQQKPDPYIDPAVSIFAKGEPQPLRYYINVVSPAAQAPGGLWKYSGATVGGQSIQTNWQNAGSSYTLPTELDAGLYSVYAARNSNGAFQAVASVTIVGVKQLSATSGSTTVTSTTDTPSGNETIYVPKGNSNSTITITITATPEPGSSWPNGYPTWKLNGASVGPPGSETYSLSTAIPGSYTVSASCGTTAKAINVIIVEVSSITGHGKSSSRSNLPNNWADSEIIYAQPKSVINLTMSLDPEVTPDDNLKTAINWSISGTFATITPDESKLGATFIPDSTGNYIVTASCGQSQRLICIKVAAPKIHSVSFGGNIQILKDTGGSYSGVAWQDNDLDGSSDLSNANADSSKKYHPIAYCSTATMSATSVFKPNCRNSNNTDFISAYDVEAAVKKLRFTPYLSENSNDWSNPVNFNMSGTTVTAAGPFSSTAKVSYHNSFELAWEVGFGEAGTSDSNLLWERSYSEHELYLTFKKALPATKFYETVLHIGCANANGKSNEQQIVSCIWGGFTGRNVKRKDGTPLSYYRSYLTEVTSVGMLLQQTDGQCGSWANFFQTALSSHGIDSDYIMFKHQDHSVVGFLVKTWSFSGTGTSGNVDFPYINTLPPSGNLIDSTHYNWGSPAEVLYIAGTTGQNNSKPASLFNNHQIIRYNGIYYDPSYGIQHSSIQSVDDSLSGFFIINTTSNAFFLQKNPAGIQINTFILPR